MKFSGTKFSHCSIQLDQHIYESEFPIGRVIHFADWLKSYELIEAVPLAVNDIHRLHRMNQWLLAKMHRPYSLTQLVAIGVGILSPRLRSWLFGLSINGEGKIICTEYLAEFFIAFYGVDFDKSNDLIDLVDIYEMSKKIELQNKFDSLHSKSEHQD
jgi:hypothetical protein